MSDMAAFTCFAASRLRFSALIRLRGHRLAQVLFRIGVKGFHTTGRAEVIALSLVHRPEWRRLFGNGHSTHRIFCHNEVLPVFPLCAPLSNDDWIPHMRHSAGMMQTPQTRYTLNPSLLVL